MIVESNLVGLLFTTGFSTRMVWNISNNDFLSINKVKINTNNIFIYKSWFVIAIIQKPK